MSTYQSAYTGAEIDKAVKNANVMIDTGDIDPSVASQSGQLYLNTSTGKLYQYLNGEWGEFTTGGGGHVIIKPDNTELPQRANLKFINATLSDDETHDATVVTTHGEQGPKGDPGEQGDTGRGIVSISRTSGNGQAGTTDTYTITYSDSTTSVFYVYNGADGQGAGDMTKTVYDTNNNGIVDNAEKVNGKTVLSDVPVDAKFTDTTYSNATTSVDGLMSKTDKSKLDGVAANANNIEIVNNLNETVPGKALDAVRGKELADLVSTKSDKSITATVSLTAAGWVGDNAPYTRTYSNAAITATNPVELFAPPDITVEQLEALQAANIQGGTQSAGSITLRAFGEKPTIDIPVGFIIRRDL